MGFCNISSDAIGLVWVCRDNGLISKEISHHPDIVNTLMSFSIFTYIKAVMGAHEFKVCLIDIIETVLIIRLVHPEDSKVCKKGEKTKSGDGPGDGSGIMLLNPSLEEMIRKLFSECCRFHRRGQITIEDRHWERRTLSAIGSGDIDQSISEGTPIV